MVGSADPQSARPAQVTPLQVALMPLVGNTPGAESAWLGALFSTLILEHIDVAPIMVLEYNKSAQAVIDGLHELPLTPGSVGHLLDQLHLDALIHGRFVHDQAGDMLGLRLIVEGDAVVNTPVEAAAPVATFSRFIERMSLALLERLNVRITDDLREAIHQVPRPASLEAFRQLASSRAAWARGDNELALTAVSSALTLDPALEAAMLIEVAISRAAQDNRTTQTAFKRWSESAVKRGNPGVGAERLTMLGHWLADRGDWREARRTYEEAGRLYNRANDEAGQARIVNNIANLDLLMGKTGDGIRTYRRTLRIFEQQVLDAEDTAVTFLNVGLAHKNQGQQEEAQHAIEEAVARAERLNLPHLLAHSLAQRGALNDDLGNWLQSEADYKRALTLFADIRDEAGQAMVISYRGLLTRQRGAYDQAERLMQQALTRFQRLDMPHEVAIVQYNLADLYLSMNQLERAWELAEQSHTALKELRSVWFDASSELRNMIQNTLATREEQRRQAEEAERQHRLEEQARMAAETAETEAAGSRQTEDAAGFGGDTATPPTEYNEPPSRISPDDSISLTAPPPREPYNPDPEE